MRPIDRDESERGAVMVMAAFFLTVLIFACALSVDTGGQTNSRRTDQLVADMAALAAVRGLVDGDNTTTLATSSASRNGSSRIPAVTNGYWNSTTDTFSTSGAGSPNAVKVVVTSTYPDLFFNGSQNLSGTAIATYTGNAGFSVGSSLLAINTMLPGGATNLNAAGYNGLLSGNVTLQALATALGISAVSPGQILATNVSAAQIATAALSLLNTAGTSSGNLSAFGTSLGSFSSTDNQTLALGSILGLSTGGGAGLTTLVNLGQAMTGALQLANGSAGITLGTGVNLGVLTGTLSLVAVVPAANSVIGPVGTSATDSQVTVNFATSVLGIPVTLAFTGGVATTTLKAINCSGISAESIGLDTIFSPVAVTPSTSAVGINLGGAVAITTTETGVRSDVGGGVAGDTLYYPGNTVTGQTATNNFIPTPPGVKVTDNAGAGTVSGSFTGSGGLLNLGSTVAATLTTVMNTVGPSILVPTLTTALSTLGLHIGSADLTGIAENCSLPTLVQ